YSKIVCLASRVCGKSGDRRDVSSPAHCRSATEAFGRPDLPMRHPDALTRATLKTPRAAATAGVLFSVLLIIAFWLFRNAIPADPLESGAWLATNTRTVTLALNLIPFAGIAFLWFIGVLRDRLGAMEDRFFATVFMGSALLFLGMLFISAA